ncbi:hypothetical protein QYM36_008783 [Artemia franciscana]|uniref:DDE Tnp4 domain-containing protein n=1 Tax=Artemia franciscana TaxID=6661 RepID=A0AA88L652_ARTSF|nr:hypothetical protein QYM36_008783 [Artemia franciscana]
MLITIFFFVDIGAPCSGSDGRVFSHAQFARDLDSYNPGQYLDQQKRVLIRDYREPTEIIQYCFGIIANKWRIFFTPIPASIEKGNLILMSCICLHNFLRVRDEVTMSTAKYINVGNVDQGDEDNGQLRNVPAPTDTWDRGRRLEANNYTVEVKKLRDTPCIYINGTGKAPW